MPFPRNALPLEDTSEVPSWIIPAAAAESCKAPTTTANTLIIEVYAERCRKRAY
jgi:hypothetical protein